MNTDHFRNAVSTVASEYQDHPLPVQGELPEWLKGILLRNGPGQFEFGENKLNHLFDGYAKLHKFEFHDGGIVFSSRFLQGRGYKEGKENGRHNYFNFATAPNMNFFQSLLNWFRPPASSHNTNVNVVKLMDKYYALTEGAAWVEFDINDLHTVNTLEFTDSLAEQVTTAHPFQDQSSGEYINFALKFGPVSHYQFYKILDGDWQRKPICSVKVKQPSYVHSFGLTQNYIILPLYPLVANPLHLRFGNSPYLQAFEWLPELGTELVVLDRKSGDQVGRIQTSAFFAFHIVNAYEDGDRIIMDFSVLDPASVKDLYLNKLHDDEPADPDSFSSLRRFSIDLQQQTVEPVAVMDVKLEMPVINAEFYQQAHRYIYGIGVNELDVFKLQNQLVKVDVAGNSIKIWSQNAINPSEPVFVPRPGARHEDEGVLLSVVFDVENNSSFLLVLDAMSMKELSRAQLPDIVPLGFHGRFFS